MILAVGPADAIAMQRVVAYALERGVQVLLASDRHPAAAPTHPLLTRIDLPPLKHSSGINISFAHTAAILREICRQYKPDVTHIHGLGPYADVCGVARLSPTVISIWGFLNDLLKEPPASLPRQTQGLLSRSAAVLVESASLRTAVQSILPSSVPVKILTLGVDAELFKRSAETRARWRRALSVPENGYLILSPRGWEKNYNQRSIVQAFHLVTQRLDRPTFLILIRLEREAVAGASMEEMLAMETYLRTHGLSERVRWLPALRHSMMSGIFSASDLMVSVPSSDAMPSTVIEAAACELPFIASDIPHYQGSFIHDGATLVDPTDPKAIATAIVNGAKSNPSTHCSARRNRVIEEFNPLKSADQLVRVYDQSRQAEPQTRPLISVIITTYNRPSLLRLALDSVLTQRITDCEIIVVDDGSSLETRNALLAYEGAVTIVYKENGGLASARNAGLRIATGHFVAFLYDDDLWMPDRVSGLLSVMKADESIDVVFGDMQYIDAQGLPIGQKTCFGDRPPPPGSIHPELLFLCNIIPVGSSLIRYSAIADVGFFDESLQTAEDYDLWLRISERNPRSIRWINQVVACYRQHEGNISKTAVDRLLIDVVRVREKAYDNSARIRSMHPALLDRYFFGAYLYCAERALHQGDSEQGRNLINRYRRRHSDTNQSRALARRCMNSPQPVSLLQRGPWAWQFVHVAKTGGTAIEDAAQEIGWHCGRFALFCDCGIRCQSHWHHPPELHPEVYAGYKLFAVVRDPLARLVSDFRYLHKAGAVEESLSPAGLNSFVLRYLHYPLVDHLASHLRPQTDLTHGSQPVDVVLPFSQFPECLNLFFKKEGIQAKISDVINATSPSVSVEDLTPASRDIIASFYSRDFELLTF